MRRLDSRFAVGTVKTLQSWVPEALNHTYIVSTQYTKSKEFPSAQSGTHLHASGSYESTTLTPDHPIYT
jgi:hypothetical protein